MECFRMLFDHLGWIEHQFLSGIRASWKTRSLWRIMRCVGGVRKSIHQCWLAKGLGLGLVCWGFKGVQEEGRSEEASTLQIGSVAFPPGQYTSPQLHPCHRLFDQDGHQGSSSPSHSPDLTPCDFWLFPKLRGCRYETIEEMKEAVTKVIDRLTQEDFHRAFQKLLYQYNKCIGTGGNYFERDKSFMCVLSIKVPIRKKSWSLSYTPRSRNLIKLLGAILEMEKLMNYRTRKLMRVQQTLHPSNDSDRIFVSRRREKTYQQWR